MRKLKAILILYDKIYEISCLQSKYKPNLRYFEKRKHDLKLITFSSIQVYKEIKILNQIDYDFCRRLIDSVEKKMNIWVSLERVLILYLFI